MPPGEEPFKRHSFPVVRDEKKLFKHNKEQYYTFLLHVDRWNEMYKKYSDYGILNIMFSSKYMLNCDNFSVVINIHI